MQNNDNNNKGNNGQSWIDVPSFVNKGSDINQVSGKLRKRIDDIDDSSELVREVTSSLAEQVSYDMAQDARSGRKRKKKGMPKAIKVTLFTLLTLSVLCGVLMFTPFGKKLIIDLAGNYIYGNLDHKDTQTSTKAATYQDSIVNILLIGVEQINGAENTDSMMIATMNTKNHTLKLTSLMRDIYVQIPGYNNNKLNSVYAKGGIDLLYNTIETNFGVKLDGYCMVNFNKFEKIVDYVHGVKVTLTQDEADYLNHTNYISKRQYRNVVAGTQTLNGNQALGYCRVRKRATSTQHDDFGRTQRQRIVLKAIYDKVKDKNVVELVLLMNKILKNVHVKTDITNEAFNRYLNEAVNLKVKKLQTLRIPTDNSYTNDRVPIGNYNVDVLSITDWNVTRKTIYNFIYGNSSSDQTALDSQTATGSKESSSSDTSSTTGTTN